MPHSQGDEPRPQRRSIDTWLKWAAVAGPIIGFLFGGVSGAAVAYQAFKDDTRRIGTLESWKDKQDDFDQKIVGAISRLDEVVKRIK